MRAVATLAVLALLPTPALAAEGEAAPGGFVDLVVLRMMSDPPRPLAGEPYRLVAFVENAGGGPLERAVRVAFFANDTPLGEARLSASAADPVLPGGRVRLVSPEAYVSPVGYTSVFVVLDSGARVAELNESNNEAWSKVPVSMPILAFENPTPGEPYHDVRRVSLYTVFDEPFSTIDCATFSSLSVTSIGRQGEHVDLCVAGVRQTQHTYSLGAGEYVATFATDGASGAALFGVPQGDPSPPEPHG